MNSSTSTLRHTAAQTVNPNTPRNRFGTKLVLLAVCALALCATQAAAQSPRRQAAMQYFAHANRCYRAGNLNCAFTDLTFALQIDPNYNDAFNALIIVTNQINMRAAAAARQNGGAYRGGGGSYNGGGSYSSNQAERDRHAQAMRDIDQRDYEARRLQAIRNGDSPDLVRKP